jgi:hypothetical protein
MFIFKICLSFLLLWTLCLLQMRIPILSNMNTFESVNELFVRE